MNKYDCPKTFQNSKLEGERTHFKNVLKKVKSAMTTKLNNEASARQRKEKADHLTESVEEAKALVLL